MKTKFKQLGVVLVGLLVNIVLTVLVFGGFALFVANGVNKATEHEDVQTVIKASDRLYKDTMQNLKDYSEGK